ncbi:MAG: hypothetical protein WA081_19725 [Desulfosalsimonadaceae bacterium]
MWQKIAQSNQWPEIVYLKDIHKLPCFPYSKGGFRNRVTGKDADPDLTGAIIEIGRYKAIYRDALLPWLDAKTTARTQTA